MPSHSMNETFKIFRMYSIRVQSLSRDPSAMTALASVPARCLLASKFYESLVLELTYDNRVIGVDYRTDCRNQSV